MRKHCKTILLLLSSSNIGVSSLLMAVKPKEVGANEE
jgi:hypothetical protein